MLRLLLFLSQSLWYHPYSKLHWRLQVGPKFVLVSDAEKVWAEQMSGRGKHSWMQQQEYILFLALLIVGDLLGKGRNSSKDLILVTSGACAEAPTDVSGAGSGLRRELVIFRWIKKNLRWVSIESCNDNSAVFYRAEFTLRETLRSAPATHPHYSCKLLNGDFPKTIPQNIYLSFSLR